MYTELGRELRSVVAKNLVGTARWREPSSSYGKLAGFRERVQTELIEDGANAEAAWLAANYIVAQVIAYVDGDQIPEGSDAAVALDIARFQTAIDYLAQTFCQLGPTAEHVLKLALFYQLEANGTGPFREGYRKRLLKHRTGEALYGYTFRRLKRFVSQARKAIAVHPLPTVVISGPTRDRNVQALLGETIDQWVSVTDNWPESTTKTGSEKKDEPNLIDLGPEYAETGA